MGAPLPDCVEFEPPAPARSTVLLLHGLGARSADMAGLVPALLLPDELRVRFVIPSAPERALTLRAGARTTAWMDVGKEDLRQAESSDPAGLRVAAQRVQDLVEREVRRGIPVARIVIGGFSQGGVVSVCAALTGSRPLAGAFALSTFLPRNVALEAEVQPANRGLPVFAAHGTRDDLVAIRHGRRQRERLEALGCDVTWREYPMAHEICAEELVDLGRWLAHVLR